MRGFTVGFIFYQFTVSFGITKSGTDFRSKIQDGEILEALETRHIPSHDYSERNYPDYEDRITSKNFQPPHYDQRHHWHNKYEHYEQPRGGYHEDYSYEKTTPFSNFYQFMTSIFGPAPDGFHHDRNRVTPPYAYEPPYGFRPTEPNYLPPPKPIRASVIKLETVTRSPIYPSFETTTKFFPHVGTILNHVLIENSKTQQFSEAIPPFKPLPVLPTPAYVPPTTIKPNFRGGRSRFQSNGRYPNSVQDQLPHLSSEPADIPYEPEEPVRQFFETQPSSERNYLSSTGTNILGLVDVRGGGPIETKGDRREKPVSFPGAVEKVNRPVFKYTKKLTAQLDRNTVERVANLTVQGYSKVNEQPPVNYVNVKNLINLEKNQTANKDSRVNLNDELSLDAKILKDTNWDGFTIRSIPTTETIKETTTALAPNGADNQRNNTAFWEIPDEPELKTTTTDFPFYFTSTPDSVETTEYATTEIPTTLRIPEEIEPRTNKFFAETTTVRTLKRKYSRRPKVESFTPYPSPEEIQKKLLNRNHYLKRQKPNITLAFGNKNVLKPRPVFVEKDETIKFADRDGSRRRKIGKRRQVFKRLKSSTSQPPIVF